MKKHCLLILLLSLLPLGGCFNEIENELNRLERRIEKLEQRCQEMNTTLDGLRTIVEKLDTYDFLKRVETLREGSKVIGYTLHFTHSDPVTLYNGTDAETPILGVQRGEDGVWYWTVKYPSDSEPHFLTDNYGVRISTSAASPEFKIENGFWMVTYDGGEIWHNVGRATGEDGASFFKSVEDLGDYVRFNLLNGTYVQLPTWSSYEKLKETVDKANKNLETYTKLVSSLNDKVYVSEMIPIMSGQDTIGCSLSLSDGTSYSFYDGTGTNAPIISVRQDATQEDVWYWTIRYGSTPAEWILDEKGDRIRANAPQGLTPTISLLKDPADGIYYWAVAYGDEEPDYLLCKGKRVPASVNVPDPVFLSVVSVRDDMVCITLDGDQNILIPLARTFTVSLSAPVSGGKLVMGAGETVSFKCTLSQADERAEVLPIAEEGFYAEATTSDHISWNIFVYSPEAFAAPATSRLNLLVSNGYGTMKTIVVTIQAQ